MALNIFMAIPGIPGESKDTNYPGRSVLSACNWSFEKLIDPASGQIASALFPGFVTITKAMDLATPHLASAAAKGGILSSCDIVALSSGSAGLWRIVLSQCRVVDYHQSFAAGGGSPTETLAIACASIQVDIGPTFDGSNRFTFAP